MNFLRMGEIKINDFNLLPALEKEIDQTILPFRILNTEVLKRAHFCDSIKSAYLYVCITYKVLGECFMESGYKVEMSGSCTPNEFETLSKLYWEDSNDKD